MNKLFCVVLMTTFVFAAIPKYSTTSVVTLSGAVLKAAAGTDDALTISTRILCQIAENEDGSKAFAFADAEDLQRFLPESVLNELELFMMDIQVDIDTAKNE